MKQELELTLPISQSGKDELQKYVETSLETESKIEHVLVNKDLLEGVLKTYIQTGQMLDQLKKHIFYGRKYDFEKFLSNWEQAQEGLDQIQNAGDFNEEETLDINPRIFHSVVGIATESVELCEALEDHLNGAELDYVNLHEEAGGDIGWYTAILMDETKGCWGSDLNTNVKKLQKIRFKNKKFSAEEANNRDLDKEREVLEDTDDNSTGC